MGVIQGSTLSWIPSHTQPTLPLPCRFNHTTIALGTQWEVRVVVECTGNTASSKWHLSEIWTWSSRSINLHSNRDLNPGVLDIWSEVGHPSLNGSQVITRTSSWLIHAARHRRTHRQKQAMAIPEDQNMPRVKIESYENLQTLPTSLAIRSR